MIDYTDYLKTANSLLPTFPGSMGISRAFIDLLPAHPEDCGDSVLEIAKQTTAMRELARMYEQIHNEPAPNMLLYKTFTLITPFTDTPKELAEYVTLVVNNTLMETPVGKALGVDKIIWRSKPQIVSALVVDEFPDLNEVKINSLIMDYGDQPDYMEVKVRQMAKVRMRLCDFGKPISRN